MSKLWRETPRRKIKNNKRTKESIRSDWTRRNPTRKRLASWLKVKMVRKKIWRGKREKKHGNNTNR